MDLKDELEDPFLKIETGFKIQAQLPLYITRRLLVQIQTPLQI